MLALKIFVYLYWMSIFIVDYKKAEIRIRGHGLLAICISCIIVFLILSFVIYNFYLLYIIMFSSHSIDKLTDIILLILFAIYTFCPKAVKVEN